MGADTPKKGEPPTRGVSKPSNLSKKMPGATESDDNMRNEDFEDGETLLKDSAKLNKSQTSQKKAEEARVRKAPANVAEAIPIPRKYSDFSEPDTMMWTMRKSGKGWDEIRAEWERLTGQKVATTTLPNRFVRIRENVGDFTEEDDQLMVRCKEELEETFSKEIWSMISEAMITKGGNKYSANAIEKRVKKLLSLEKQEESE